jgi:hypothetical protein
MKDPELKVTRHEKEEMVQEVSRQVGLLALFYNKGERQP